MIQISPSQISEALNCSAKYFYHRILKLPQKRGIAPMYGTAIDGVVERMLLDKKNGAILGTEHYRDMVEWSFMEQNPGEVEDEVGVSVLLGQAKEVIDCYYRDELPVVDPMETQIENKFDCDEFAIHQIWDLRTIEDIIVDIKAPLKRFGKTKGEYRAKSQDHVRQLYCYYRGFEARHGYPPEGLELHYLFPPETKVRVSHPAQVVKVKLDFDGIKDQAEEEIVKAWGLIQGCHNGEYHPNRSRMNFLCSERWCSYWDRCHEEFDEEVSP